MTAKTIFCGILLAACGTLAATAAEPIDAVIAKDLQVATAQYRILLDKSAGKPGFPRTVERGELKMVGPGAWTAGFFPGSLWYLYEATGDAAWKTAALRYTALTAPAKFDKTQHDVGFILGAGYGNGLRLVADPATRTAYRDALLAGASPSTRATCRATSRT